MRFCLLCLKAWLAWWRPRGDKPVRFYHYLVASLTLPAFFLIYVLLRVVIRLRGPFQMDGAIPGGAIMNCRMPDVVQLYAFLFGVWEPDISAFVQRRLSDGDTFCDVGSHVGYYSLLASARVGPGGRVVAIEASPTIFEQLQTNLAKNGVSNVRAQNVAATAEVGLLNIHRGPAWNLGWSTTHTDSGLPLECQVTALPLDQILTAEERRTVRLIKVDVEGTERELFGGLANILRDGRPDTEVVLEVSPRWWQGPRMTIEQSLQPFVDAGFHIYLVDNNYGPWRYFWANTVRSPQRVRSPIKSWVGQKDIVLSRLDHDLL